MEADMTQSGVTQRPQGALPAALQWAHDKGMEVTPLGAVAHRLNSYPFFQVECSVAVIHQLLREDSGCMQVEIADDTGTAELTIHPDLKADLGNKLQVHTALVLKNVTVMSFGPQLWFLTAVRENLAHAEEPAGAQRSPGTTQRSPAGDRPAKRSRSGGPSAGQARAPEPGAAGPHPSPLSQYRARCRSAGGLSRFRAPAPLRRRRWGRSLCTCAQPVPPPPPPPLPPQRWPFYSAHTYKQS
eukprot:TRINITY_DN7676_c0_g1_i2.p1 TRINITY_DN7676_c0_g1~~TRINITY_DN7676_c0_g1_i2.p1  ORF type:complete len:270 (+),score=25.53 TRINITY_DN7676_c0_g1_i2:87-812(+)